MNDHCLAFEWVALELQFPTDAQRQAFKDVFLAARNEGQRAYRKMEAAWPEGARWLSGEEYLRTLGWRPPAELTGNDQADIDEYDGPELMELLYHRLFHVGNRLYRDAQVRQVLDPASPQRIHAYTHAHLNRHNGFQGDPCGHGVDKIVSIEEGLRHMEQPSHSHPACCCTVDPFPVGMASRR